MTRAKGVITQMWPVVTLPIEPWLAPHLIPGLANPSNSSTQDTELGE